MNFVSAGDQVKRAIEVLDAVARFGKVIQVERVRHRHIVKPFR